MRADARRVKAIFVTILIAATSLLFAGNVHAAPLTLTDCVNEPTWMIPLNQESSVATFEGGYTLKCGKPDPQGFGVRHIMEAHSPVTNDLIPCIADVLKYGVPASANAPNKAKELAVGGEKATVVYLPQTPPLLSSIVTAYTNGKSSAQWTLCKNLI